MLKKCHMGLSWSGRAVCKVVPIPLGHHNSNDPVSPRSLWLMILLIRVYGKGRQTQRCSLPLIWCATSYTFIEKYLLASYWVPFKTECLTCKGLVILWSLILSLGWVNSDSMMNKKGPKKASPIKWKFRNITDLQWHLSFTWKSSS